MSGVRCRFLKTNVVSVSPHILFLFWSQDSLPGLAHTATSAKIASRTREETRSYCEGTMCQWTAGQSVAFWEILQYRAKAAPFDHYITNTYTWYFLNLYSLMPLSDVNSGRHIYNARSTHHGNIFNAEPRPIWGQVYSMSVFMKSVSTRCVWCVMAHSSRWVEMECFT